MKRIAALSSIALLVGGVLLACGSDPTETPPPSSGSDAGDGASADTGLADAARPDAPASSDSAADTGVDADASLPPLCKTYPDSDIIFEGEPTPRWDVIGYRAMTLAGNDCAIGAYFTPDGIGASNPIQLDCYAAELRAVAGCPDPVGQPYVYDATTKDANFAACLPAVKVGFKLASPSAKDVERFITRTRDAAIEVGMAPADAARLEQLLLARKPSVVVSASSDYTQSSCDGGI